jgi:hypothetical protein
VSTEDTRPDPLVERMARPLDLSGATGPADELASLKRSCRILANIVARNHQAMEAARIEMRQNGPHQAMQWILNSIPDVWDDPETEWDGKESAQAWFDRTESFYRAAKEDAGASASDDSGRTLPTDPGRSREHPGAVPADYREALGRAAFGAHVSGLAEEEQPPWQDRPPAWEELSDADREFYMRIGHDVANYALTENAITWGTSCTRCAGILDSAYAETVRREKAEAKLAAIAEHCRRYAYGGLLTEVLVTAADILAIIGSEKEADRG